MAEGNGKHRCSSTQSAVINLLCRGIAKVQEQALAEGLKIHAVAVPRLEAIAFRFLLLSGQIHSVTFPTNRSASVYTVLKSPSQRVF